MLERARLRTRRVWRMVDTRSPEEEEKKRPDGAMYATLSAMTVFSSDNTPTYSKWTAAPSPSEERKDEPSNLTLFTPFALSMHPRESWRRWN